MNYAAREERDRRRRRWWAVCLALAVLAAGLVLYDVALFENAGWVCAACGSERSQRQWRIGLVSGTSQDDSALANWMMQQQRPHVHDWRSIRGTGVNYLGRPVYRAHGIAPPIYRLRGFVDLVVRSSSDEQLIEMVRNLEEGSDDEQSRAVDEAEERMLTFTE